MVERWRELSGFLLYKYLDGNVKDALGNVTHPGYPDSWYEKVAGTTGDRLRMKKMPPEVAREEAAKAVARELAAAVLALLEARGVAVDDEIRGKIEGTEDPDELEGMLVRAARAETADEVAEER